MPKKTKTSDELREELIDAGREGVEELIMVARSPILGKNGMDPKDELAADKMKNAAAAKKLAIFDAFEILARVDKEEKDMNTEEGEEPKKENKKEEPKPTDIEFPEDRAKKD